MDRQKFQNELRKKLEKYSDRCFYVLNEEMITYGELLTKACALADYLKNGYGPVVVYGHKNIEMVISFIGCILAGRSYVPVDIFTPLERIEKIINISNSTLVINNSGRRNSFSVNSISNIHDLEVDCCNDIVNDNEVCYIIFTSGSTGVPKGVPISYKNLWNFIEWISGIDGLDFERCNVLNQASFSFDLSIADFYYALFNGHTLIGSERMLQEDLGKFLEYININNVNLCIMTPTFMRYLLLDKGFGEENYSSLKIFYFCGEILDGDLVKKIYNRFPNSKVINAYGPTEATSAVSSVVIENKMLDFDMLPVGCIDKCNNDIEIIDNEIVIKGKSVFSGYLDNIIGGFYKEGEINCYKTGDLGRIEDGYLYCLGRIDDQVKLNGYRIEIGEIEKVINDIDGVDMCCVVSKRDSLGRIKYLKAYVVGNVLEEEIFSRLSMCLPSYMIPKFIDMVNELPVNNNGKLDRKKMESL